MVDELRKPVIAAISATATLINILTVFLEGTRCAASNFGRASFCYFRIMVFLAEGVTVPFLCSWVKGAM